MKDRPPFLDRLGDELEEGATAWSGRRRKRRQIAGGLVAVLALAGGAVWFASDDESAQRPVVADSPGPTDAVPEPTTSVPRVAETIVTDAGLPQFESDPEHLLDDAVVATEDGVFVRRADGPDELVEVSDRPAFRAFLLEETVVYQDAEPGDSLRRTPIGAIVVEEGGEVRRFEPDEGSKLRLHDFAIVRGRPTVLASSVLGAGQEDSDHRLVMIYLDSGERNELGSFGSGPDRGIADARLAGDSLVMERYTESEAWVEVVDFRSAATYEIPLLNEPFGSLAVVGSEVWIVDASGAVPDGGRAIDVRRHRIESGEDLGALMYFPEPDSVEIAEAFCLRTSVHAGHLICDQSSGPPIAIDLADGSRTTAIPGFTEGTVSFAAPIFDPRAECDVLAAPLDGSSEIGTFDLDGDGVDELMLEAVVDPERAQSVGTLIQGTLDGRRLSPIGISERMPTLDPGEVVDLDGDGVRELVFNGFGNTAHLVMILRLDGCDLEQVVDEAGDGIRLLVGASSNSCASTGCPVRNRCLEGPAGVELESTVYQPAPDAQLTPASPPEDVAIVMTTTRYRLEGFTLVELDRAEERFDGVDELPSDAPTLEDSDTIDC